MDSNKIFDNLSKMTEARAKQAEKERQNGIAEKTFTTTTNNNKEFNDFITTYNSNRKKNGEKVRSRLKTDSSYTGDRNIAVKEAWKIEQADISMGGKGIARNWTKEESTIILSGKAVPGCDGHHEKNVAEHPEEQANPDNIGFYNRKEHLKRHNGNFKNPTDGKLINKGKKLQKQIQNVMLKMNLQDSQMQQHQIS